MILEDELELGVIGTFDRGMPNRERIALAVRSEANLGEFLLILAVRMPGRSDVFPLQDHVLWFTHVRAPAGSYVVVYTGPGEFKETLDSETSKPVLVFHWGRTSTLLADQQIVPVVVRMQGIDIESPPQNTKQLLLPRG